MPRIRIEAPGQQVEDDVELDEGEAVLVGRSPDAARVDGLTTSRVSAHAVPSPSVSSNHVLVTHEGRRFHVRDLDSRNGTWVRVPEGTTVELPPDRDLQLRLAVRHTREALDAPISPPQFDDLETFGDAMSAAIRPWFVGHGIHARVEATRDASARPTGSITLPLASGETLCVQTERTLDARFHELMAAVARYVTAQNAQFVAEQEARRDGMILSSRPIRAVHRQVVDAALRRTPRLVILGPSGTGKESLARTYHRHLARSGQLVTVNCATLSRERIVADLFGAEAGAYTGAQRTMLGAVERADGGTLFLDEIGELSLDVQAQLLRFLDTGEYQRLGAIGLTRSADVCVVAATNRDLRRMVNEGTFRLDLFFRIALEIVEVPPLRDRIADAIAYLATQSLGATSALEALSPDAVRVLEEHAWAGNFRELVNLVQRLPRPATAGSIDATAIQRMLGAGAIAPIVTTSPSLRAADGDWTTWLRLSADAYAADHGSGPATWGEMSTFIELYLKPHALVHMAGVVDASDADAVSVPKVAEVLRADRGTVTKQLRRYFDSRR